MEVVVRGRDEGAAVSGAVMKRSAARARQGRWMALVWRGSRALLSLGVPQVSLDSG